MKFILLISGFLLTFSVPAYTQGFFKRMIPERPTERPQVNAAKIVGGSCMIIGGTATMLGGYMWVMTGGDGYEDITARNVAIGGIVMFAAGTGLLIGGVAHDRKARWSLVVQKKNEVGIAYNF